MKNGKKILIVFSIILASLVVITLLSLQNINIFSENTQLMARTSDVSKAISDHKSLLLDIETSVRGYVITGQESFLTPYYAAINKSNTSISQLHSLTIGNPLEQKKVDTLEQISKFKKTQSASIISIRQQGGFETAMKKVRLGEGKRTMDKARVLINSMQELESNLLLQRTKVTQKSLVFTKIFVILGGVFSILAVIILMFFIRTAMKLQMELKKSKEHAEQLVGFKDQFLASMSHEIRTPLNGIIGFTKILLRNETMPKQKPHLDAIKTSSDILLVLINDILDLAKIEAGKMEIEKTELKLSEIVNSILGSFELRFQEKELKIKKQYDDRIPKILLGDPVRINQILLNLISNSVKFTGKGGKINISINIINQDSEQVDIELIVSDTGIGIPTEKLETIFEPFTQSSSDIARRYGGTGLGLSIVKRLMDLMGGTISVKSKLNEGSIFTIVLPFKKTTATEISNEIEIKIHANELIRLGKLKVLLVEDIPINQFLAQTILHDFGFESDTAENGKIAIELLKKNNYDIILMDLMMPEMDGFETTKYIRNAMLPKKSTIPIIALTADVTKVDVDKCYEVGMDDYVSKPINETDLLNKIARLIINREVIVENKICNLDYLKSHSPNNPKFLSEMIGMILKQTPEYISETKRCLANSDWNGVHGNVHKIRPSIDFMGMPKDISHAAKMMDEYAATQQHLEVIPELFSRIEKAFLQAYIELEEELMFSTTKQND